MEAAAEPILNGKKRATQEGGGNVRRRQRQPEQEHEQQQHDGKAAFPARKQAIQFAVPGGIAPILPPDDTLARDAFTFQHQRLDRQIPQRLPADACLL